MIETLKGYDEWKTRSPYEVSNPCPDCGSETESDAYGATCTNAICERCEGEGEIYFNPSPLNDPQCEDYAKCPDCNGTGGCDWIFAIDVDSLPGGADYLEY